MVCGVLYPRMMCESNSKVPNEVPPCHPRNCGTISRYVQNLKEGVSCERCRAAKAAYELQRRQKHVLGVTEWEHYLEREVIKVVLKDYEAGNTRTLRGCAIRLKMRSAAALVRRAKLLGIKIPIQVPPHGTLRRYRRGCGCEACRFANRVHTWRYDTSKHRTEPEAPEHRVDSLGEEDSNLSCLEFPPLDVASSQAT